MMIVSSQHYLNWNIVEEKIRQLMDEGATEVVIPCWNIGECDGIEMAIQSDKHHTLAAARNLGLNIRFELIDEPEGMSGLAALDARYADGDWYNVETSDPSSERFNLVW